MTSRLRLHRDLLMYLDNVYFNPPESVKMKYPCIRYYLSGIESSHADNIAYKYMNRYTIVIITPDPDDDYHIKLLENFSMCSYERSYISDNLVHHILNLYY